ncbi:unnamed protein product, partial [Phaeothamnion confervicola]
YEAALARAKAWTESMDDLRNQQAMHERITRSAAIAFEELKRQEVSAEAKNATLEAAVAEAERRTAQAVADDAEARRLARADAAEDFGQRERPGGAPTLFLRHAWALLQLAAWRSGRIRQMESRRLAGAAAAARSLLRWWRSATATHVLVRKAVRLREGDAARLSVMKWRLYAALERRCSRSRRRRLLRVAWDHLAAFQRLQARRWRARELRAAVLGRQEAAAAFRRWVAYHRQFVLSPREEKRMSAVARQHFLAVLFGRWHLAAACAAADRRRWADGAAATARWWLLRRAWIGWAGLARARRHRRGRLAASAFRVLGAATARTKARQSHLRSLSVERGYALSVLDMPEVTATTPAARASAAKALRFWRRKRLTTAFDALRGAAGAAAVEAVKVLRERLQMQRRFFSAWAVRTGWKLAGELVVAAAVRRRWRQAAITALGTWVAVVAASARRRRQRQHETMRAVLRALAAAALRMSRKRLVRRLVLR